MGTRLIRQPDGKWGLWSTVSDRISILDCDEEELVKVWGERAARQSEESMRQWLEEAKGEHPRSVMSLEEALREHQFHSDDIVERGGEIYADELAWDKDTLLPLKDSL